MEAARCFVCRQALGEATRAFRGADGERLCLPCAMGLSLPDRRGGASGEEPPRFVVPPAVAEAVSVELDIGTGRSWGAELIDFSADGLRLACPVRFPPGTPAVVTFWDRGGLLPPALFAVEVRWVRQPPGSRPVLGAKVIAAVDGHHAAFLGRILERVAGRGGA
ncbi:MAG TPA: PilZ domain-containing protein [Thermodesulfobacteriota bacterium]|nr:PilZ domain-containing protein [Thermodesulfobacteriota bacterium]